MIHLLLAGALLLGPSFAEQTGTTRPKLATPPAMEGCDVSDLTDLVGQPFSEALQAHAKEASGAATVRVFHTGDVITQDLRPDRLNLELNAAGQVVSARCY